MTIEAYNPIAPHRRFQRRLRASTVQLIGQVILMAVCVALIVLVATDLMQRLIGVGGLLGPLKLLILVPMLLIVAQYHRYFFRGVFAAPELSLLLGLALVSVSWSLDKANTMERLLPLLATSAFSMTIGAMLSLRGLVIFLASLSLAIAVLNFASIATLAEARGAPPWENTWRGIHNHKNGMGATVMVGTMISFAAAIVTNNWVRMFFVMGALLSFVLLVASESRTSQIITIIGIMTMVIAFSYPKQLALWSASVFLIAVGIVFGSYVMLATGAADPIFDALERKATLSGRIPLWQLVWPSVLDKFWLGYGYVSFWDPEARRVVEIARDPTLRFTPYYSHNGLIETLLNVGFAGTVLVIGVIFRLVASVFLLLRAVPGTVLVVPIVVYTVAFMLHNVTESSILSRDNLLWMIFVMMATKMCTAGRALRLDAAEQRRQRRASLGSGARILDPQVV